VVAKLRLRIEPTTASQDLETDQAAELAADPPPRLLALSYGCQRGGYRLTYDRTWYVTSAQRDLVVLRQLDRGELVAQCHLSPLARKAPGRHVTLEQFQKDIRYALNDRFGEFVQASEWTGQRGQRVFRVVARGTVQQLPIQWRYYLVAQESGSRMALAFTVEEALAKRLGDTDRELVQSIELLEAEEASLRDTALHPAGNEQTRWRR
jgi:hypothetical protein